MHGIFFARWLALWLVLVTASAWAHGQNAAADQPDFAGGRTGPRIAPPFSPESVWREPARPHPLPQPPVRIGLSQIARAAGIIFSGTVTSISRAPASGRPAYRSPAYNIHAYHINAPQVVAITFRVERAFRGASAGQSLTVYQWIALWTSGQRYRVGERVLLFLYPPSKLGLTSCVGGAMGRFVVDPMGQVVLSGQPATALGTDAAWRGKSRVSMSHFARAVRQAREEE